MDDTATRVTLLTIKNHIVIASCLSVSIKKECSHIHIEIR